MDEIKKKVSMDHQSLVPQPSEKREERRSRWRRWLKHQWQGYRWFVIGCLWLLALLFGYLGFSIHFNALGQPRPPLHLLYLSFQLFTLESGSIAPPIAWPLEVARWLAPAVAAYTAFQTLALIFREQVQLARLRFFRNHTVICGLGRKGFRLARGFRQRGEQVVVIESDEENDLIEPTRSTGAVVLAGSATQADLLRSARAHLAKRLIAVCGMDGVNAEVGVLSAQMAGHRPGTTLECILHITNPELCSLLREREIESARIDGFRLRFFNVFDTGARALLREHPPFDDPPSYQPRILLVGLGRFGENVTIQMAKLWSEVRSAGNEHLLMTVVDQEAAKKVESLRSHYPQLDQLVRFDAHSMDVRGSAFHRAAFLVDGAGSCQFTKIYVCLDSDSLGLSTALTLRQQVLRHDIPIIVRMGQETGLIRLVEGIRCEDKSFENLNAFGLLDRTCTPDQVLGGTHEIIARAIHEGYLDSWPRSTPQVSPTHVPWEQLPEDYRESCRRQADHIGDKLRSVNCGIAPSSHWSVEPLELQPGEVSRLAEMEHDRWRRQRLNDGWRKGPKDPQRRTNPYLVPWGKLPPKIKEANREMIRSLPSALAQVGLKVIRKEPPTAK